MSPFAPILLRVPVDRNSLVGPYEPRDSNVPRSVPPSRLNTFTLMMIWSALSLLLNSRTCNCILKLPLIVCAPFNGKLEYWRSIAFVPAAFAHDIRLPICAVEIPLVWFSFMRTTLARLSHPASKAGATVGFVWANHNRVRVAVFV